MFVLSPCISQLLTRPQEDLQRAPPQVAPLPEELLPLALLLLQEVLPPQEVPLPRQEPLLREALTLDAHHRKAGSPRVTGS